MDICNKVTILFINRILGIRKYLFDLSIEDSSTCRLCSGTSETLIQFLIIYEKSEILWNNVKSVKDTTTRFMNDFNTTILLGYLNSDTNIRPINSILSIVKNYIFYCAS